MGAACSRPSIEERDAAAAHQGIPADVVKTTCSRSLVEDEDDAAADQGIGADVKGPACSRPLVGEMDDAAEYQGIGAGAEGPAGCRPWVGETDDAAEHQSSGLDGESRCLDAFAVALSQAHARREEEGAWYASTLELQLASVDFCRACRGVPTLHVRVLGGTPPTLWAPRQDESRQQPSQQTSLNSTTSSASKEHGTRFIPSRVPRVRAASLTCTLGEAALARSGGLESWGYLRLCGRRSWSESQLLEWPQRLRALTLDIEVEGLPVIGSRQQQAWWLATQPRPSGLHRAFSVSTADGPYYIRRRGEKHIGC